MVEQINPKMVSTPDDVIDGLGGTNEVARLMGTDPRSVSNWRKRGLPPETFVALTGALNGVGLYAPPSLWRMRSVAQENA